MKDLSLFYGQPWQIRRDVWYQKHAEFIANPNANRLAMLSAPGPGAEQPEQNAERRLAMALPKRPACDAWGDPVATMQKMGDTHIVPIVGTMLVGASPSDKYYGGYCAHEDIHDDITAAVAEGAKRILFYVDSPGGTACGTPELADRIACLADMGIQTAAFTARLCCSAAYFAVAGCDDLFCAPSAMVGSIGTIWETVNVAEALAKLGIEWNVFTSDGLKGTGHPARKLTDEQKKWMQSMVDTMANDFKDHVTQFRKVEPATMRGQIFTGSQAADNGLFDFTADNLGEALQAIAG